MTYPVVYKTIPVRFAFYVHENGLVQIMPVSEIAKELKFGSEKEARKFIKNYKEQL